MQTIEVPVSDYVRMHEADQLLQDWAKRCQIKDPDRRVSLRLMWGDKFIAFCQRHKIFIRK